MHASAFSADTLNMSRPPSRDSDTHPPTTGPIAARSSESLCFYIKQAFTVAEHTGSHPRRRSKERSGETALSRNPHVAQAATVGVCQRCRKEAGIETNETNDRPTQRKPLPCPFVRDVSGSYT